MSGHLIRILLVALLTLPYILLFFAAQNISNLEWDEFFWAAKNTLWQGLGTTAVALVFGFVMSFGIPKSQQRSTQILLLLPMLLPSLFVILVFLASLNPFPYGNLAVILIQGFLYSGLVAVLLHNSFKERLYSLSEMAQVLGANAMQFFWKTRSLILRDLATVAFIVFVASTSSFAIPLIVSGGSGTNLEILIYEKIRLGQNWGQAASLVLIQLGIALGLSFALNRLTAPTAKLEARKSFVPTWFFSKISFAVVGLYLIYFCGTLLGQFAFGWSEVQRVPDLWWTFFLSLPISLSLSFLFGALVFLGLCAVCFLRPKPQELNILRGWIAPSTAIVGFAFISLEAFDIPRSVSYLLALWGLYFVGLWRMGLDRRFESLGLQLNVADISGASRWLVFKRVVFPQVKGWLVFLSGLASLWAFCDFALAKIILGTQSYTVLIVESLLSSYRSEAGLTLAVVQLFVGSIFFILFGGIAHVLSEKFK